MPRLFCAELESGSNRREKPEYEKTVQNIRKWYLGQYQKFSTKIQNNVLAELIPEIQEDYQRLRQLRMSGLSDNLSATADLFNMADILCKILLSVYTYGPDSSISVNFKSYSGGSWMKSSLNFNQLVELLQHQLSAHGEGERINLAALTQDRTVRNGLTHRGKIAVCLSAIRCYNTIREMLVFMDSKNSSTLPRFPSPTLPPDDLQGLLGGLQSVNFSAENTLLIAGSLHDIPQEDLKVLANVPWTAVVDLDGYSSEAGLRKAVTHRNVHDQKLTDTTASSFSVISGYTKWFTCGDFCNYKYSQIEPDDDNNKIYFTTRASFCDEARTIPKKMENRLRSVLEEMAQNQRPLKVLFLHYNDNQQILSSLLNLCEELFVSSKDALYQVFSAYDEPEGAWDREINWLESLYQPDLLPFSHHVCDMATFFSSLRQYPNALPQRTAAQNPHMLPSEDGITQIPDNLASSLAEYFDVCYMDSGEVSPQQGEEELAQFYCGGSASWSVLRQGDSGALPLLGDIFDSYVKNVRESLLYVPEVKKRRQKIINLIHTPGIGGSTLLRQVGWKLHEEFPTLLLQKYDSNCIETVRQLYDNRKKGTLILVDESVRDIDGIKKDVEQLPRACALVISGREGCLKKREGEKEIPFKVMALSEELKLRKRFRNFSALSDSELDEREKKYEEASQQSRELRCPFIMGLYYQDELFNGVSEYVGQMMNETHNDQETQALAMLALCDRYSGTGLPKLLINRFFGIPLRSDYLHIHPYAKSVVLLQYGTGSDVDRYRMKHYLISGEVLEQCSRKLYNSTAAGSLTAFSKLLIDTMVKTCDRQANTVYLELLERLFIDNSGSEAKFSNLVMSLPDASSRYNALHYLAEKFGNLTKFRAPDTNSELYMTAAHFYGHLGRLCRDRQTGVNNPEEAVKYCQEAVSLMNLAKKHDSTIYHMCGEARMTLLQKKWDDCPEQPNSNTMEEFEAEIEEIQNLFDQTAYYGSADYAIISQIRLYIRYLQQAYKWAKISQPSDIVKLSQKQASYRMAIEELLYEADNIELSTEGEVQLRDLEQQYRGNIMMNDYGNAISYYENLLSQLSSKAGQDLEIQAARRGIVSALWAKYKDMRLKNGNPFFSLPRKDLNRILDHLEKLIGTRIDVQNYRQRMQRVSAYDRWFHLAKMKDSGKTLSQALTYAEQWMNLDGQSLPHDPRPYYYYYVLALLQRLEGNSTIQMSKIRDAKNLSCKYAEKGYSLERIHDLLINGSGLQRLLDTRYAGVDYLSKISATPTVLSGEFTRNNTNKGYIKIHNPVALAGEEIKFTLGRQNTVTEKQLTHKLATFVGFSYEQITAVNQYVKDLKGNESAPSL